MTNRGPVIDEVVRVLNERVAELTRERDIARIERDSALVHVEKLKRKCSDLEGSLEAAQKAADAAWAPVKERDEARAVVAKLFDRICASPYVSDSFTLDDERDVLSSWGLDPVNNKKVFEKAVKS